MSAIPESSRRNTILGTGYLVYKKKSLMVSDTSGATRVSWPLVCVRLLSLCAERYAGSRVCTGPDMCRTRMVSVCRHSCRAGISRRRNIDLRYTTKRASISVGNEAPRFRLFDVLLNARSPFAPSTGRTVPDFGGTRNSKNRSHFRRSSGGCSPPWNVGTWMHLTKRDRS